MLLGFFISPSFTLVEVSMADVVSPSLAEIGLIFSFSCMEGPILISGYIYEGIGWKVIIVRQSVYLLPYD